MEEAVKRIKVIGVGLNKTGTKTLKAYLEEMGYKHQTYSLPLFNEFRSGNLSKLFSVMEDYDSFEDWPWPLMYREIDKHFPDALFILTVRKSPETWYKSLCKMAVRMGPFNDFEKHIYGYNMPQGKKNEHLDFYAKHNKEVEAYFKDRPHKLLKICWENGDDANKIAQFLGVPHIKLQPKHLNKSIAVYGGDNLWLAHVHRILFKPRWFFIRLKRFLKKKLNPS